MILNEWLIGLPGTGVKVQIQGQNGLAGLNNPEIDRVEFLSVI